MNNQHHIPGPQRIQVKVFTNGQTIGKDKLIAVFHSWIQKDVIADLMIDVADYSHVPDGPGILLIGHQADYAFDEVGGPGLRYTRKKEVPETLEGALVQAIDQLLVGCRLLETSEKLSDDGVTFDRSVVEIALLDRRLYPNTLESLRAIEASLIAIIKKKFNVDEASLDVLHSDPRFPATFRIQVPVGFSSGAIDTHDLLEHSV